MMSDNQSIYGIIGNPVKHSLSPVMHNAAFRVLDVEAVYKLFPLNQDELKGFFEELRTQSSPIFGLNVTVPFKEEVIPFMDRLAPFAQKVNAVNTIVVYNDRKLTGYNTDGPGFMAHLAELQINTSDQKIAILGSGGSTRAILTTLCVIPERPRSIKIYNRTAGRAEALLTDLKTRVNTDIVESVMSIDDLDILDSDILVNTTSVGLNEDDPCLVDPDLLHSDLFVYDLIYNPCETTILKMSKEQGAKTANGLGMLFYQGVLAFQHWADTQIEESVRMTMREALEEAAGL